ncbi:hypothetical protein QTG54_011843 [Skeletonema marinoi]|uniref:Major facilitator superfamily (MFS) profile domain-containing protein n=1 Tax=Skeletonema marinoi TaxID=267567 RepID=A0AAD8Y1Z4_9STRA|nr:hypothetical protein QTG54_011843 [Skeletonema marinoi]
MAPPTWTSSTATTTRSRSNMIKNVLLLAGMWGMGLGAAFVQLPATQNLLIDAGYASISTAPLGIIMLGSAPCAVVIPKIISRYGEKKTFIAGSFFGIVGAIMQMIGPLTTTIGLAAENDVTPQVVLVVIGALPQAFMYASTNNLRFSVSQFSTPAFLPKATALVLLGGVLSALLGPLLSAQPMADSDDVRIVVDDLSLVERQEITAAGEGTRIDGNATTERALWEIIKGTDLPLLTTFQCLSYNIMAMYMGQLKLPMAASGYSVINQFGTWSTTAVGFLLFPVGGSMFLINDSLAMFVLGITIVGIGWNFSFVGPSAEVSKICSRAEQSKVVGFNDGIMLLTVGIFFMTASKIYIAVGSWNVFNYILIGFSVFSALLSLLRWYANGELQMEMITVFPEIRCQSLLTAGSICTL